MGDNRTRGMPVSNTYTRGGIQSKQQLNSIGAMLSNINVDGGDLFATDRQITIKAGGKGANEKQWSFGKGPIANTADPKTFTVYAGRVRVGLNAYIDVAETELVLSNDPEFICVRYSWADKTASVVAAGSVEPLPNEDYYYQTYYKLEQNDSGRYILSTPGRFARGDLVISGAFGDG